MAASISGKRPFFVSHDKSVYSELNANIFYEGTKHHSISSRLFLEGRRGDVQLDHVLAAMWLGPILPDPLRVSEEWRRADGGSISSRQIGAMPAYTHKK